MEIVLAIDGGGSRTRCLALDRAGRVLGSGESGPSNHLLVDAAIVASSLEQAIASSLEMAGLSRTDITCVSAGLAGVDYDGRGREQIEEMLPGRTVINGDMVIAHAGALGGAPGVMALAGTGSVVLGIGAGGERVKVGGWGPIYGDEGSAYQIARRSLVASAMAFDGRGPKTALLSALASELGVSDFRDTVSIIYAQKLEPRQIAGLCRVAYETAEAGDEIARTIFRRAGDELAESSATAIRAVSLTSNPVVSYQGSVLHGCPLVRERFSETLKTEFPDVSVVPPRFAPVIGAYLFACSALGWSLSEKQRSGLRDVGL